MKRIRVIAIQPILAETMIRSTPLDVVISSKPYDCEVCSLGSILARLWRVGKTTASGDKAKIEKEVADWEGDLARRGRKSQYRPRRAAPATYSQELQDAFLALEVPIGSDWETSHRAFRKMARKYHPDKWHNDPKRGVAEELFNRMNQAFDRIKAHYGKR